MKKYNFVCVQTIFNDRMDTKKLRQKILDLAIHGKLVPQDSNDEPASVLLERIRAEKERLIAEGKIKRSKKSATSDTSHYENVPFEVPEGWCWRTLGDIGTWQAGGTPSRMHKEYYGGNIPWLKTGDLNDGIITSIPENITEEGLNNSSAKLNPTGSVLIAMYGATIGKIGILGMPATTNQACCACINYKGLIQKYLFYFLLSHKKEFIALGGGGAQPNISKDIIVKTLIPIPPIKEQERIVSQIDNLLNLLDTLDTNKYALETLISHAKSKILDLAIHGKLVPQDANDEPALELLKRINPKAVASCDNPHYVGDIPSNWVWTTLGSIGKWQSGGTPSKMHKEYYGGNIPWLKTGDLNDALVTDIPEHITELGLENSSAKLNPAGSVLIAMYGATIGKVGILGIPATTNQACCACIEYKGITQQHLFLFLLANKANFVAAGGGGAQPNISKEIITKTLIPLPPIEEQNRIVAKVKDLFSQLDLIEKSLQA